MIFKDKPINDESDDEDNEDNEDNITIHCDIYSTDVENNTSNQLREDVNLNKTSDGSFQNYYTGNQITNPRGLSPDKNGFYNSYGEYEIKYKDENEELNILDIDLEKNDYGCTILGSSTDNKHESLYNKVENYYSYLEENMSHAISNLKNLVLNN